MVERKISEEGLSWNPMLTILETNHILVRLSHSKKPNIEYQKKLVDSAHSRIFRWESIERKLFFKLIEPGVEFSDGSIKEKEFKGFVLNNNEWFLAFHNEDTVFLPIEILQRSEQINSFRDEKVSNN